MARSDRTRFRSGSIQGQLLIGIFATTAAGVLLSTLAMAVIEYRQLERDLVRRGTVLAEVIGYNSQAPLLFDDAVSAGGVLESLSVEASVIEAIVFDARGDVFARYTRRGAAELDHPKARVEGVFELADGELGLHRPILADGERVGTVYIRSDARLLADRAMQYAWIIGVVLCAASGVSWLGARMLRVRITTPLTALAEGAAAMASGNLQAHVPADRADEIGQLSDAFNTMSESLRGLVLRVAENGAAVSETAGAIETTSAGMRQDASHQARAVEDTTESIESLSTTSAAISGNIESLAETASTTSASVFEMDSTIAAIASHMDSLSETIDASASSVVQLTCAMREIAASSETLDAATDTTLHSLGLLKAAVEKVESNAQESHSLSEAAVGEAEEGMDKVQQTVRSMNEIQRSFRSLDEIIMRLSDKSQTIGEVVKVIEGVVEQTNLLALNAAIISSHAGEHGRAFSVVAEEVKNLADRTAGSTREIVSHIETVQLEVSSAVEAMAQSADRVDRGVSLSSEAGAILQRIGDSARQSTEKVHEIVEATGDQSRDIQRVDEAMAQMKTIAQQFTRSTHEQNTASGGMTRSVEQMRQLGEEVKLSIQEQRRESRHITAAMEQMTSRLGEIVSATQDQGKRVEQIVEAVAVFREVMEQSSRRAGDMQRVVATLATRSRSLEEEMGRFQL